MEARFLHFAVVGLLSAMMLTLAHAQSITALPSNIPPPGSTIAGRPIGVSVVTAPPAGFNPLTASPIARAQYAIPPAPDPKAAPRAYDEWRKAVIRATGPLNRGVPALTQTNMAHGPAHKVGPSVPHTNANNVVNAASTNWSGASVVDSQNPFTVVAIISEFVVPTARQAFGACTGGWDFSALWPGVDGNGSNDVLQAGVEADAYCNGGATASFYSAWIEWFPFNSTRVSYPAIHSGDLIFAEVWNTSPTTGYAYFVNFSTYQSAAYQLTAPSGTSLVGNSVEWIVERPGIGGGALATLTNYIDAPWPLGVAWNYTAANPTYYFEGQNPPTGTLELITMLDDSSNGISSATVENTDFLWFQDFGSACGHTGAPPC